MLCVGFEGRIELLMEEKCCYSIKGGEFVGLRLESKFVASLESSGCGGGGCGGGKGSLSSPVLSSFRFFPSSGFCSWFFVGCLVEEGLGDCPLIKAGEVRPCRCVVNLPPSYHMHSY